MVQAVDNHVFLTIFTAYQCKVHRVVARKVHPSLLGVGKNYAWATKCPHAYCAETPICHAYAHIISDHNNNIIVAHVCGYGWGSFADRNS